MAKYLVTTRVASIIDADSADSAVQYFLDATWEIEESYSLIFDSAVETVAKELFD